MSTTEVVKEEPFAPAPALADDDASGASAAAPAPADAAPVDATTTGSSGVQDGEGAVAESKFFSESTRQPTFCLEPCACVRFVVEYVAPPPFHCRT